MWSPSATLSSLKKSREKEGAISYVEPRRSVLSRQDAMTRRSEHIIAANIDQVLITASVVNPPLKPSLIDRYIIAAQKGRMEPVVVINKIELLEKPENATKKRSTKNSMEAYDQRHHHPFTSAASRARA